MPLPPHWADQGCPLRPAGHTSIFSPWPPTLKHPSRPLPPWLPGALPLPGRMSRPCPRPAPPPRLSSRLTPSASGTLFGPVSPHRASFPERRPTLPSTVTPPPGWPQALQVPSPIQETAPCLPHFLEVDGFTQQTPTGLRADATAAGVGTQSAWTHTQATFPHLPESSACWAPVSHREGPRCPTRKGPGCRRPGSRPCRAVHRQPNHMGWGARAIPEGKSPVPPPSLRAPPRDTARPRD